MLEQDGRTVSEEGLGNITEDFSKVSLRQQSENVYERGENVLTLFYYRNYFLTETEVLTGKFQTETRRMRVQYSKSEVWDFTRKYWPFEANKLRKKRNS